MEHIGSGWQFDAYADRDGVLKVPKSTMGTAVRVLRSYPDLAVRPLRLLRKARLVQARRDQVLHELARREIDPALLAGFRHARGGFRQERVRTLGAVLEDPRLDPHWALDRYIRSILDGWRAGFAEKSFNFTVNHGVDRRGRVVVIDVGELVFTQAEARRLIEDRFWEGAFSVSRLPEQLRTYLLAQMSRFVTVEELMRSWTDAPLRPLEVAPDRAPRRLSTRGDTERAPRIASRETRGIRG